MTLHEEQETVQSAMKATLSGLQEDPWLTQRVLANAKGEEPVVKRVSATVIIAIALIVVAVTGALAAGLGLFDQLSHDPRGDSRLSAVDQFAEPIGREWTTEDGITIRIEQAYFEGNRVFIAYRMSGSWNATELHEGAPEETISWSWEEPDMIAAQTMISDIPERQQAILQLDGSGQRWIATTDIGLHDDLSLADGTYLDIIGGDDIIQADGSVIGWKECEIPEDCLSDTLTFQARLYRNRSIMYQDGTTYRQATERGETTSFEFTLRQNHDLTHLRGSGKGHEYTASVELTAGRIDLRGKITVTCPASWIQVWGTWENPENLDIIGGWALCRDGAVIEEDGVQGIAMAGENQLVFEVLFDTTDDLNNLTLVPIYEDQQPRMDEAIPLSKE
ncbi:MAG: DUF4179 domain-containing protein [Clostridia bacterium]|nr:DUF4179 domain-containing protein [Clostridia bacterium]